MNNKNLTFIEKKSVNTRKQYLKLLASLLPNEKFKTPNNKFTQRQNNSRYLPFIKDKNNKYLDSFRKENNLSEGNNNMLSNDETNYVKDNKRQKHFRNNELNIRTKRNDKYKNSVEVNNIVNSLINTPINKTDKYIYSYDKVKDNNKFPREKMIDPLYYIKYNINNKSLSKGVDKSLNKYMQDINENKSDEIMLNDKREVNYGKIKVDPSNFSVNEDEKKFKYMLKQIKEKRNFNFGLRDINYFKKIKAPIINFDKKMKENKNKLTLKFRRLLIDNNKKNKIKFIESDIDKKIDKCKSFDERMEIILNNTKMTQENINKKSKYHEKLINKINFIYKSY